MVAIGVPAEKEDEPRIGLTPETVKKLVKAGATVTIRSGAGLRSHFSDADYSAAGAKIVQSDADAVSGADIVLTVRRPEPAIVKAMKKGAALIGMLDPFSDAEGLDALAKSGVALFSMELMPRISRAQVMDVLSSQSNLAGYKAVVDAAAAFERALPMMMTAAGTVPAARVFVMGVGVAGLQAIATARRLGAIVTATDVRPAVKEQVASLGAKFIAVEDEEFKQAETSGGYAKEMSDAYKKKQADLVAEHVKNQDIIITTALIPGRPAPKLLSKAMIESMRPGSIIVDLAAERGGNAELTKAGRDRRAQRRAHFWQAQSRRDRAGQRLEPLCAQSPGLHRALDRQREEEPRHQFQRRARQRHVDRQGRRHRQCDDRRAARRQERCGCCRAGKARKRQRQGQWQEGCAQAPAQGKQDWRRDMMGRRLMLALAILALAVLADSALMGSALAQEAAPAEGASAFVFRFSIFVLAIFVGYYVVWSVTPALHTPLMSVTNAISSVIVVGALLAVAVEAAGTAGGNGHFLAKLLGFAALIMASVNIFGGFLVTQRMLAMYQKKKK